VTASDDRQDEAWTGSWTESPGQTVRLAPSAARLRGVCAASAPGAPGRASHNPPVVGSSPTRPTSRGLHVSAGPVFTFGLGAAAQLSRLRTPSVPGSRVRHRPMTAAVLPFYPGRPRSTAITGEDLPVFGASVVPVTTVMLRGFVLPGRRPARTRAGVPGVSAGSPRHCVRGLRGVGWPRFRALSLSEDMIHNEAGNRAETFGRCAASGLLIVGRTRAGLTRSHGGDGLAQASC
jgi:hypothetical protein